jgi:sugar/nucleoside kinase (ribokinase family)
MSLFAGDDDRRFDITGIENALLDLLAHVDDSLLERLDLVKGTMRLVEIAEQRAILDSLGGLEPEIEPGGSCANVLRAASLLGVRTCYSSAVGRDTFGEAFALGLEEHGVTDRCAILDGDTGTSVILVSADGERTMNTHLGVCRRYSKANVPEEEVRSSRLFFTTAYIWDTPNQIEAIEHALALARSHDVRLAVDLADPFAVERSRDVLHRHLAEGFDVVFANAEEARMMTGLAPAAAAKKIAERTTITVVTDGVNGAYISSAGEDVHVPAHRVEVVDTTGAGDCFAAGFLTGLVQGLPLRTCAELATLLAADTITHFGVKLSADIPARVRDLVSACRT